MSDAFEPVRAAERLQRERFHVQQSLTDDPPVLIPAVLSDGRLPSVLAAQVASPAPIAEHNPSRRGEVVSRRAHNAEIPGSSPGGAITHESSLGRSVLGGRCAAEAQEE